MDAAITLPLFAEERREKIVQLLEENSKILVPELCEIFDVSPATIRSDLRDLESEGKLKRTHGGAIPKGKVTCELDADQKAIVHIDEKKRIAAYAAQLIENGDTIALDGGTTTLQLAKQLDNHYGLTIVTNDIKIAYYLEMHSSANIIFLGGLIRRGFHRTTGPMTLSALNMFNVDKAFMGANAFSLEKGFTTPDIDQAEAKKAMMAIASQIIMVLDSSKLGKISFTNFAGPSDIDKLIIDAPINGKVAESIKESSDSLELILVK